MKIQFQLTDDQAALIQPMRERFKRPGWAIAAQLQTYGDGSVTCFARLLPPVRAKRLMRFARSKKFKGTK